MSLFWSKKIEPDKIIYTRTKRQIRTAILLMVIGLLLLLGTPTLMVNSSFFMELFSHQWSILFFFFIGFGIALIFFVAISFLIFYFKFMLAKRGNKKFQITKTNEEEVIVIEK